MPNKMNEATTYDAEGKVMQSVVSTIPKAESSVEVTTNSKGEPQLTVKVYHEDVKIALTTCMAMYERGLAELDVIRAKRDEFIANLKKQGITNA